MSKRLPYAEARRRIEAVLNEPRDTPISPDFFPGGRNDLVSILVREGRSGLYGEHFEDLRDPQALHVPGVMTRTDIAVLDAIADTRLTVIPDYEPGRTPAFGLGNDYARAGTVDVRGLVLALATHYQAHGNTPPEFSHAAMRIATSGTHAAGTAHRIADKLRKNVRAAKGNR